MADADIFGWLVAYHCTVNLQECIPHITGGRVIGHKGRQYYQGEENKFYTGTVIIANGDTLADRLIEDGVVKIPPTKKELYAKFRKVGSPREMHEYLSQQPEDGAQIYDGVNNRIAHVKTFNNSPPSVTESLNLEQLLPEDFASTDGSVTSREGVGNRTYIAMILPHGYENTEGFQIRQSAYGNLGMGKVTHFVRGQGLKQEFWLEYDNEKGIMGVHRKYVKGADGRIKLESEERKVVMPLKELGIAA